MSSAHHLREFISERLTAAAEEIFSEFEKTIVRYEEEIDRQRRLLDITWNPQIKLHRAGLPQRHICKEEESLAEQELNNQEERSSLDQEDFPDVKEEEKEVCSRHEGEQLILKQERDLVLIPINLLSHVRGKEAEDQERNKHTDGESTGDEEMKPKQRQERENDDEDSPISQGRSDSGAKSVRREVCGEAFRNETAGGKLEAFQPCQRILSHTSISHTRIQNSHSSERCGALGFNNDVPLTQERIHMNQKPFLCRICRKNFSTQGNLLVHMRVHTGERMYCKTCGKGFTQRGNLLRHMRTHTGERPFTCGTCGKRFSQGSHLFTHMRIHTGEKPYACGTCGKGFSRRSSLRSHLKAHI